MRVGKSFEIEVESGFVELRKEAAEKGGQANAARVLAAPKREQLVKFQQLPFNLGSRSKSRMGPIAFAAANSAEEVVAVQILNAVERLNSGSNFFPNNTYPALQNIQGEESASTFEEQLIELFQNYPLALPFVQPSAETLAVQSFMAQQNHYPNRSLIGPGDYSDAVLKEYAFHSLSTALSSNIGHVDDSTGYGISPAVVPTFIGGKGWREVERSAARALQLLGVPVNVLENMLHGMPEASDVFCLTGFGPQRAHSYVPYPGDPSLRRLAPDPDRQRNADQHLDGLEGLPKAWIDGDLYKRERVKNTRESTRREWLFQLPETIDPQVYLLRKGGFEPEFRHRLRRIRLRTGYNVQTAFSPRSEAYGYPIGRYAWDILTDMDFSDYAAGKYMDDELFERAVERVFERPWFELDLQGPMDLQHDTEVALARAIIRGLVGVSPRRKGRRIYTSAVTLLGMSIVSGVPLVAFLEFGLNEWKRTGECWFNEKTLDDLDTLLELLGESETETLSGFVADQVAMVNMTMDKVAVIRQELEVRNSLTTTTPKGNWASKLRRTDNLLWSHRHANIWSIQETDDDGHITYRQLPDRTLIGLGHRDRE